MNRKSNRKIIVQILRAPAGGIRKHVEEILEEISKENVRQIFITNLNEVDRDLTYLKTKHGVEFFHVDIQDSPSFKDLINIIKIYSFLRAQKPTLLHGHGAKGGIYARVLSRLLSARSVYTPHGGSLHRVHGKMKNLIYDFLERVMIPFTDVFLFESNYTANVFYENIGNVRAKAVINPNGVKIPTIESSRIYKAGEIIHLKSFGLLRELKGHDIVIRACHILKEKKIPFHYKIYGDGDYEAKLRDLIREYRLEENVEIKDYACNVFSEMLESDFVIHPSRFESFGYVPAEAMSVKVPVIVSSVGGLKEVVDEETGYVSQENTPESYANILSKIFKGDDALENKIIKAKEKIKIKFSHQAMLDTIKKVYFSQ